MRPLSVTEDLQLVAAQFRLHLSSLARISRRQLQRSARWGKGLWEGAPAPPHSLPVDVPLALSRVSPPLSSRGPLEFEACASADRMSGAGVV